MSDEEIISLFFARDEQALVYTEAKYGPYCFALANAILPIREDAEETVSDTYLKAWQTIPPKRPSVLRKSGMPLSVETPAPPKKTMRSLSAMIFSSAGTIKETLPFRQIVVFWIAPV